MNLAEIQSIEYQANKDTWSDYRAMVEAGEDLASWLPELSGENSVSIGKRRKYCVDRVNAANLIQQQVDILTQAKGWSLRVDSVKFEEANEKGFTQDSDSLLDFMIKDAAAELMTYGECYLMVDREAIGGEISVQEAENLPPPTLSVLTPDVVTATAYETRFNRLLKGLIFKAAIAKNPDEYGFSTEAQRVWTMLTDEVVRIENEKGELISEVVNSIGQIQVVRMSIKSSILEGMKNALIAAMQHWSIASFGAAAAELGHDYIHDSEYQGKEIESGISTATVLSTNSKVTTVFTPVAGIEVNQKLSDMMVRFSRDLARDKMVSMGVETGALQQSGVSKKWDRQSQNAFSAFIATQIKKAVPSVVRLILAYIDPQNIDAEVDIRIPEEFVMQDYDEDRKGAAALQAYAPKDRESWIAKEKELSEFFCGEWLDDDLRAARDEALAMAADDVFSEDAFSADGPDDHSHATNPEDAETPAN